jgi:hypothetical protein
VRRGQKTPICLHVGMGVAGLSDVKNNAATQCGLLQVICINGAIGAWACIVHAGRVASITGPNKCAGIVWAVPNRSKPHKGSMDGYAAHS